MKGLTSHQCSNFLPFPLIRNFPVARTYIEFGFTPIISQVGPAQAGCFHLMTSVIAPLAHVTHSPLVILLLRTPTFLASMSCHL